MPEPDRILRVQAVLHPTGLRRSTLYRKIAEGSFPRQSKNQPERLRLRLRLRESEVDRGLSIRGDNWCGSGPQRSLRMQRSGHHLVARDKLLRDNQGERPYCRTQECSPRACSLPHVNAPLRPCVGL
jgi:predicted DNA-binding transcriptional regulator AlpA